MDQKGFVNSYSDDGNGILKMAMILLSWRRCITVCLASFGQGLSLWRPIIRKTWPTIHKSSHKVFFLLEERHRTIQNHCQPLLCSMRIPTNHILLLLPPPPPGQGTKKALCHFCNCSTTPLDFYSFQVDRVCLECIRVLLPSCVYEVEMCITQYTYIHTQ